MLTVPLAAGVGSSALFIVPLISSIFTTANSSIFWFLSVPNLSFAGGSHMGLLFAVRRSIRSVSLDPESSGEFLIRTCQPPLSNTVTHRCALPRRPSCHCLQLPFPDSHASPSWICAPQARSIVASVHCTVMCAMSPSST
ncbi:hypothetical protein Bca101_026578 [Brassica carinata]